MQKKNVFHGNNTDSISKHNYDKRKRILKGQPKIKRNWQGIIHKRKTNRTETQHNMCWEPLYAKRNSNNVNMRRTLLQTTGGKDFYVEIVTDITTRNSERKAT